MNKKLGRLLRPGMGGDFLVLGAFCAAALLEGHYWLAAAETAVTLLMFILYIMNRTFRDRQIQNFIQSAANTLEATSQGEGPLPLRRRWFLRIIIISYVRPLANSQSRQKPGIRKRTPGNF